MKRLVTVSLAALLSVTTVFAPAEADVTPLAARPMENLGRGVVAVRSTNTQVLVSWRLLGLDPTGIGFNVYRSAAGGAEVRLNSTVLTGGTNFTDSTANLAQTNQPTSTRLYTLAHNPAYRNAMTLKGYMQSHHPDYFLGAGMTQPPRPNITYAGA